MQNVVGPTLVAMATKFGLCAEIQSPTGLFTYILTNAYDGCRVIGYDRYKQTRRPWRCQLLANVLT